MIEVERGNIDLAEGKAGRFLEIGLLPLLLQLRIGDETNRDVRPGAVNPDEFEPADVNGDDTELRIFRLGFKFRHQAFGQPVVPGRFRVAVYRIDAAGRSRANEPIEGCSRPETCNITARAAHMR